MKFYLETGTENQTDTLALHGEQVGTWNGLPVILVTAEEFRGFISAWSANDPNGTWEPNGVHDLGNHLAYEDGEGCGIEVFPAVDLEGPGGATRYEVSGWNLIPEEGER